MWVDEDGNQYGSYEEATKSKVIHTRYIYINKKSNRVEAFLFKNNSRGYKLVHIINLFSDGTTEVINEAET
jgi:hypothetical protein